MDKFHDPCHDYIRTHGPAIPRPHRHGKKGQEGKEKGHQSQPQQTRSKHPDEVDRDLPKDRERSPRSEYDDQSETYAPGARRDRDWDDRGRENHQAGTRDRGFDGTQSGPVAMRGRDAYGYAGGYQVAVCAPIVQSVVLDVDENEQPTAPVPPPPPFAYAPSPYVAPYDDRYAQDRRRPIPPRRRDSSYSPPRRHEQRRSFTPPRQRKRSTSPNHHRVAATLVGALAGGLLGNTSDKSNKWTTIAGAVVGGLGGRELEKVYDRRQDRGSEENERRERRRSERDRR